MTTNIYKLNPKIIGQARWDAAVDACSHPLPYARWHHLEVVTGQTPISHGWEIWANNKTVEAADWIMPIPFRARGLFRAVTQPLFTQQLGVFFKQGISEKAQSKVIASLIKELMADPWPVVYSFSGENTRILKKGYAELLNSLDNHAELAPNFIVDLSASYQEIRSGYAPNLEKKLRRQYKHIYSYHTGSEAQQVVELFEKYINKTKNILEERHLNMLNRMVDAWLVSGRLTTTLAHNEDGELLAGLIYLKEEQWPAGTRYSCVMGGATALGKKHDSQMKLMDHNVMTWQAEGAGLYDFEGSRIPGINKVFATYGGQLEEYLVIRKGWGKVELA